MKSYKQPTPPKQIVVNRIGKNMNIKHLLIWLTTVLISCFQPTSLLAAGGDTLWIFQDPQAGIQETQASAVDSAGNLIFTGYSDTSGSNANYYTIKVSADGQQILWTAPTYDMAGGDDWALAVVVDGNDDIVVTGFAFNGINYDMVTIKYDGQLGTPLWNSPFIYNGSAGGNDLPQSMAVDSLNNVYIAGYSQNGSGTADDAVLFKLGPNGPNPDGSPLWQVEYNGPANSEDRFNKVATGPDGLAVTGHSTVDHSGRLDFDYLTIKYDYAGNEIWKSLYDHGYGQDTTIDLALDSGGNVVVTGRVLSGIQTNIRTIKYSASGDGSGNGVELWATPYTLGSPNIPYALSIADDDEVFITGSTFTVTGKEDFYTARYAGSDGVPVWQKIFDSAPSSDNTDVPQSLAIDQGGGLFVTGYTYKTSSDDYDFQTLKYNRANGNQLWQRALDGPSGGDQQPLGIAVALGVAADGNVMVAGWSDLVTNGNSDYDYYAVKYDAGLLNTPTGLNASLVSEIQVDLSWQDNSIPTANEDNFCIERCAGFACQDFTQLTCAVPQDQVTYSDTSVTPHIWYSYQIKAYSATNGSSYPSPSISTLTTLINYPAPTWIYTYDQEGLDDSANAIAIGTDNHPVALGLTTSAVSQFDYFTVKLDRATALPIWEDLYDDPDGEGDLGTTLAVDGNNQVIVSGYSSQGSGTSGNNTNDIFTIKYAADGPDQYTGYPLWTQTYNGPGNGDDRSHAVATAADGTYSVITGYGRNAPSSDDDIYLIKYDATGTKLWEITPYNGGYDDFPTALALDTNGNIVVVGKSYNSSGNTDLFAAKYSGLDGSLMTGWPFIFDAGNGNDSLNDVAIGTDGSVYLAGFITNASGNRDIYINKLSSTGVPQWGGSKTVDGTFHADDEAKAASLDITDGDIVVAVTITGISGSKDFGLLRYQSNGTLRWQTSLDRASTSESLTAMAITPAGDICLAGNTGSGQASDILAVKYNYLGTLIGSTIYDGGYVDAASAMAANAQGECYIAGHVTTGPLATDDYDFLVFRFEGTTIQAPAPFTAETYHTIIDLHWRTNSPNTTGYKLFRQVGNCPPEGPAFIQSDLLSSTPDWQQDYTDSGLNINSSYCYGIQAVDSLNGAESRIIFLSTHTSTPTAPDLTRVTPLSTSEIEICWHDNTTVEDGFIIQRCVGSNCDFSQHNSLNAPPENDPLAPETCIIDTAACDAGSGKTFRYRVQAVKGSAWNTAFSGPSANTTPADLIPPSSLLATRISDARVDLQWNKNSSDETDFIIERCLGNGCNNFAPVGSVTALQGETVLTFIDTSGLQYNSDYQYRILARKNTTCGDELSLPTNEILVSTVPLAPTATATAVTRGTILLSWQSNTTGQTGFQIERCDGAGCSSFAIINSGSNPSGTSYIDNSICYNNDGIIRYQVKALGGWGESIASPVAEAQINIGLSPANLTIERITEAEVDLSWQYPDQDRDGFTILRCPNDQITCDQDPANFTPVTASPISGRDPALQGLWLMDLAILDGSVGDVHDSSGKGQDASSHNGTLATQPGGQQGYAAAFFDGVDDYITTNIMVDQSTSSPGATFMAWIYPTTTSTGYRYIMGTNNDGSDWGLTYYCNGTTINLYVYNGQSRYYAGRIYINQWQHVAVVYALGQPIKVYRDGSLLYTLSNPLTDSSSAPLTIGRNPWHADEYFDGFLDEVAVFNRPLSQQEIQNFRSHTTSIMFHDLDISMGGNYTYRIQALKNTPCNDLATVLPMTEIFATIPATPSAPINLVVIPVNTTHVDLSWQLLTSSETNVELERCDDAACDFSVGVSSFLLAPGTSTYADTSLCQGGHYRYRVRAVKGDTPSWQSAYTPPSGISNAHAVPVPLSLTVISESEINISWTNSNIDDDSHELGRCLYNPGVTNCDQASDFSIITTLSGGQLTYAYADSGLSLSSTYYYRVRVSKGAGCGWTMETIAQATTLAPPPPANLQITCDTTSCDLAWVDKNGSETAYIISRCAGVSGDCPAPATFSLPAQAQTYTDSGVCPGQPYTYRVWAEGPWGQTSYLEITQNTNSVPPPPTNIIPSLISEVEIDLTWNYAPADENGLTLERCLGAACSQLDLPAGSNSYQDSSLTPYNNYCYRIRAYKTASCSGGWQTPWSSQGCQATTIDPGSITVSPINSTTIDLAWLDPYATETGTTVERCDADLTTCCGADPANCPGSFSQIGNIGANLDVYTDTSVCQGQVYTYRAKALGNGWNGFYTQANAATSPAAQRPTALSALAVNGLVDLQWNTGNGDESQFLIERDCGNGFSQIDTTPGSQTTYTDSSAPYSTACTYLVQGKKTAPCPWTSLASDSAAIQVPPAPPILNAMPVNSQMIDLSWTDAADEDSYELEIQVFNGSYMPVTVTGQDILSYTHARGLNPGTEYTYRIRAVRGAVVSAWGTASTTTPAYTTSDSTCQ